MDGAGKLYVLDFSLFVLDTLADGRPVVVPHWYGHRSRLRDTVRLEAALGHPHAHRDLLFLLEHSSVPPKHHDAAPAARP